MDVNRMNAALQRLRAKYAVAMDGTLAADKASAAGVRLETAESAVPLLPWRVERRFVELKKIIDSQTLEDVSTLRFAAMQSGVTLAQLLYREFDLCEHMIGAQIVKTFAVISDEKVANVIVTFDDNRSASVECSAALPEGTEDIDRHEIIARRGVACDRVVDTQVPQSSIYTFTADGVKSFTDTDEELFGFSNMEITAVRAAFEVLKNKALAQEWAAADSRLQHKVSATLDSADKMCPAYFKEGE